MDWWYKSNKHAVTEDNKAMMQDAVRTVLREGKSLASVSLYEDKKFFYIKTTNKILLNHFLFQNGFKETEEKESLAGMNLLFG